MNSINSKSRGVWTGSTASSAQLFITGLISLPAFLLNGTLWSRAVQLGLFILLSVLNGTKLRWLPSLVVGLMIVFFNSLIPYGRELAKIGGWHLTEGALFGGLEKAITLQGLVILSRHTVRSDLKLPTAFGRLLGDTFRCFDQIYELRGLIKPSQLITSIDQLLLATAFESNEAESVKFEPVKSNRLPPSHLELVIFSLATWLLYAAGRIIC